MKTVFELAGDEPHSVFVQKFSATTYVADFKDVKLPTAMRRELDRKTIGSLWRARVGRAGRWYYGWSAEEALRQALIPTPPGPH